MLKLRTLITLNSGTFPDITEIILIPNKAYNTRKINYPLTCSILSLKLFGETTGEKTAERKCNRTCTCIWCV